MNGVLQGTDRPASVSFHLTAAHNVNKPAKGEAQHQGRQVTHSTVRLARASGVLQQLTACSKTHICNQTRGHAVHCWQDGPRRYGISTLGEHTPVVRALLYFGVLVIVR
jgi:hypothetical protein